MDRIQYRQKLISAETEAVGKNLISAIVSTEDKDRDGDIIRASGWDLEHFLDHPILLSSHNYSNLTNIIGEWKEMSVQGKKLRGVAEYYVGEGNAEADWGFKLASRGKAAYSVGFIPDFGKAKALETDGFAANFEFRGQELLEVSHVTVPSNRQALQTVKSMATHPIIKELISDLLEDEPPVEEPDVQQLIAEAVSQIMAELDQRFAPLEALLQKSNDPRTVNRTFLGLKMGLQEAISGK